MGGLSVIEGGVCIRVGGARVIGSEGRTRGGVTSDGRIGVGDLGHGVPETPSGLSWGVHCLNVTRLA